MDKKNIILSYPRSGNHLMRFFIELITEAPTYGCIGNRKDMSIYKNKFNSIIPFNIISDGYNENSYYKYHFFENKNILTKINKLILIVRNPREVLLRHNNYKINKYSFNLYFDNLNYFLQFDGPKKIFYYEDIISNKFKFINKLYLFLNYNNFKKL